MNTIICSVNGMQVTSRQCKLFDMYKKYIQGNSVELEFSKYQEYIQNYDITFEDVMKEAKDVYEKIMQ